MKIFDVLASYFQFWPYAIAALAGAPLAVIDHRMFRRPVLAVLLVAMIVCGGITMQVSPFTFHGGDHYFQGLLTALFALAALVGYLISALVLRATTREGHSS